MKRIERGSPRPLGATPTPDGVNFALYSRHATRVEVCIYDGPLGAETARFALPARTGDVWHGLLAPRQAGPGTCYAFCVDGPNEPDKGLRFDPSIPLLDPCARRLAGTRPLRGLVIDPAFDWRGDRPPATPWRETLIYELHVKGFTQRNPGVPPQWRGKYLGLTAPPVIEHLKSLGVSAVELLPCQAFVSENFLIERGLTNYWGYNPVAWFAPAGEYAVADAVGEFKVMVKALHQAGLEVILDVVFNHTAEGNEAGPMLSFKGIDNPAYYRLMQDRRFYENVTGCGNTVNCAHPEVQSLIIDCLKYWVEEMHVDGFRFDLATVLGREAGGFNEQAAFFAALRAESSLAYVKLIAEPWDVGLGGYQLGRFPAGWSEWNDRYRDAVRAFWRRDFGCVGEFAERFAGSSDIFRHNGRKPTAGINFVTSHDGFSLGDLVSYDHRHNEANLENNADGHSHNLSWNCGVEGPTRDPAVCALRKRQMKNLLATLLLSQGVPMLQAGDEFGRTQQGNNNAYCQDNEISWVDWELASSNADLVAFVQFVVKLRRTHVEFRRDTFLKGAVSRAGTRDVVWLHAGGSEMSPQHWQDQSLRSIGVWYGKRSHSSGRLLLLFNAGDLEAPFVLPDAPPASPWVRRLDSFLDGALDAPAGKAGAAVFAGGAVYPLAASSIAVLEC